MKTCLLAITGSISALKGPEIIRSLQEQGFHVHCAVTRAGREFVTPGALAALSGNPVLENEYFTKANLPGVLAKPGYEHLDFAKNIDLLLVAPATADTISRLAQGRANGLFETVSLATKAPIVIAPAMNSAMLSSEEVKVNIDILKKRGIEILPTERGKLACGEEGDGKLLHSDNIAFFSQRAVSKPLLSGKKILITLGSTREPIDPVRVLSNSSSGKMGIALAKEAFFLGAEVFIVAGSTEEKIPDIFAEQTSVRTGREMLRAIEKRIDTCNMVFFVAAVSDFMPVKYADKKIDKQSSFSLELKKTIDIAATIGKRKRENQKLYGFALQTGTSEEAEKKARDKMKKKFLDGIIVNSPEVLGSDSGEMVFLIDGEQKKISGKKERLAQEILQKIIMKLAL